MHWHHFALLVLLVGYSSCSTAEQVSRNGPIGPLTRQPFRPVTHNSASPAPCVASIAPHIGLFLGRRGSVEGPVSPSGPPAGPCGPSATQVRAPSLDVPTQRYVTGLA
jgi:hypothetical protein